MAFREKEESGSFLKKRTKKFLHLAQPRGAFCITLARHQEKKFFASFFQKRSAFLYLKRNELSIFRSSCPRRAPAR
jgi:hypothetical protein